MYNLCASGNRLSSCRRVLPSGSYRQYVSFKRLYSSRCDTIAGHGKRTSTPCRIGEEASLRGSLACRCVKRWSIGRCMSTCNGNSIVSTLRAADKEHASRGPESNHSDTSKPKHKVASVKGPSVHEGHGPSAYHTQFAPRAVELLDQESSSGQSFDTELVGTYATSKEYAGHSFKSDDPQIIDSYVDGFHESSNSVPAPSLRSTSLACRRKHDLSYRDVRKGETNLNTGGHETLSSTTSSEFRSNTGMRSIVRRYMLYIEPLFATKSGDKAHAKKLDRWLREVFSNSALNYLERNGYIAEDVVTWSWVLAAKSDLSIRRYTAVARDQRRNDRTVLPKFIPLQMLRSAHINRISLNLLLAEIEVATNHGESWNNDAAAILLIRLLRHARACDISCYERITNLVPRLLPPKSGGNEHANLQRLTHFYNRFMTLLALPTARNPFLSIDAQQRAQLNIARSMMQAQPHIPLNREGYRALARVQVLHQKTTEEQQWSSVKAPSWPPWRRDELGIDTKTEYPGKQSRVSKVIKRLLEAGYGPESMEHEAQILSGWDTDKSPTVQVRRLMSRRPLAWIKDVLRSKPDQPPAVDHNIWAARVAATRSIREAWLCFYSYMQATNTQGRQLRVYHEMFHKLIARTQDTNQRAKPSPGDGKEVYPDPMSARDLVYVPKEPPTVDELYGQMLQDGIRPAGRLLASLIDSARTLKQGLDIIHDSSIGDVNKDVLLHPEKYPGYAIRDLFSRLPDYLLASYIGLLTKGYMPSQVQLYWPGSRSAEERGSLPTGPTKPLLLGMTLLQIWKPRYMPAYHAALEGVCIQAKLRHTEADQATLRDHAYSELWKLAKHTLCLLEEQELEVDLLCYRKIVLLIRNSMIRAPAQFGNDHFQDVVSVVKTVFVKSVRGDMNGNELLFPKQPLSIGCQPYWKDVESLILMLGFGQDFKAIIQLLGWMNSQKEHLDFVDDGGYKMQRLLCAARVALEGSWTQTGSCRACACEETLQQARRITDQWMWPEDVDVNEFQGNHQAWARGMKAAARRSLA